MKNNNHNKTLRKIEFLGRAGIFFAAFFGLVAYSESSEDIFTSVLCFFCSGH
jgi:hypothetical protein